MLISLFFIVEDIKIVNSVNFVNRQFSIVFPKFEFEGEREEGDFFEYYRFLLSFVIYNILFSFFFKKRRNKKYRKRPQYAKLIKLTIDKIDDWPNWPIDRFTNLPIYLPVSKYKKVAQLWKPCANISKIIYTFADGLRDNV